MPSNLRRLAADSAALHGDNLPPYYLLPPDDGRFAAADDLTQFNVLLTGPPSTPYSQGLWRLHLKMPDDYPNSPPKATFRTRIWHPNVDELSGAVCVDILKRDWQSKLTLRDVLITISCLLIHPNPDSALNSSAGTLLREDYEAFAHQAKLMTSIHALIPTNLQDAINEAKHRGEDPSSIREEQDNTTDQRPPKQQRLQTGTTKKPARKPNTSEPAPPSQPLPTQQQTSDESNSDGDSENDDPASASKENNPSLSPTPVRQGPPPSPRKSALGKRPLSVLVMPYPGDPDTDMMLVDSDAEHEPASGTMTASEQNISANTRARSSVSPVRKSPKLTLSKGGNASSRLYEDLQIYEDVPDRTADDFTRRFSGDGKENRGVGGSGGLVVKEKAEPQTGSVASAGVNVPAAGQTPATSTSSKSSSSPSTNSSSSKASKKVAGGVRKVSSQKAKPRIGIRRL